MKLTSTEELIENIYGKKGTPKRDAYEKRYQKVLSEAKAKQKNRK